MVVCVLGPQGSSLKRVEADEPRAWRVYACHGPAGSGEIMLLKATTSPPPVLTAVENVAYFDTSHGQWCVSQCKPGSDPPVRLGLIDAWLDRYVWPEGTPPTGMRVTSTRPS
jgi:hypothetical protein